MEIIKKSIRLLFEFLNNLYLTAKWFVFSFVKSDFTNYVPIVNETGVLNVLGNGPSLSEELMKMNFHDGDFSVVNRFYESPYFFKIKPRYYVIADPFFFEKEEYLAPIVGTVTWEMFLFVTYSGWINVKKMNLCIPDNIKIVPYHTFNYKGFKNLKMMLYRRGLSMPIPQNVLVPSIFNGINMGYKKIYLYGADHSWTRSLCVDKNNMVCAIDKHFYDTSEVSLQPYLRWNGNCYKLHELLRDFATMFDSYHQLKEYSDIRNCHIINKTKDSFIDAFDRE